MSKYVVLRFGESQVTPVRCAGSENPFAPALMFTAHRGAAGMQELRSKTAIAELICD